MNSIRDRLPGDINIQKDLIMHNYTLGLDHYKNSLEILENNSICDFEGKEEGLSHRILAIEYLEKAIMEVDKCDHQLRKIDAYLLLIEMNSGNGITKIRDNSLYAGTEIERISLGDNYSESPYGETIMEVRKSYLDPNDYLYRAIEIARIYIGDNYSKTPYGEAIMESYRSYIDPSFMDIFGEEHIPFLFPLIHNKILSESKRREQLRLDKVVDISNFIHTNDSSDMVITKLEEVFGPIRILIISEESSQVCVLHRVDEGDIFPDQMKHMSVNIFDKARGYSVSVDRGSNEPLNQFKEADLEHIINPIIQICIAKKEYESFEYIDVNMETVESFEKINHLSSEVNDYDSFITDAMNQYRYSRGLLRTQNDIGIYSRAIDICRCVMLSLERDDSGVSQDSLLNTIDGILGGNIDVIILGKVQTILLSCNETMSGTGYPFGLSKKAIPLEGKIFSIIRAYEALCFFCNKKQALVKLQQWTEYGYFDTDILHIFLENIKKNGIPTKQIMDTTHIISDISIYRKPHYEKYMDSLLRQLEIIKAIEDGYREFRNAEGDKNIQKVVIKIINEQSLEVRKLNPIRKLAIETRHGPDKNDIPGGAPGDDDDVLTVEGVESSRIKGAIFDGLELHIVTSPILRACQTAAIICQRVRGCACDIIQSDGTCISSIECPLITYEASISNPKKYRDNGRYNSLAQKILVDNTDELMEYLVKLVSSSEESTTLFVTHRDSGRHIIFWLKNLFDQDRIRGEKTPIDNDTVIEFYFKGDHLIEGEEAKTQGLLFSIFNWKSTLHEINVVVESTFGEVFYSIDEGGVDLIRLHDLFINFMHRQNEDSPERIGVFIEQLSNNPVTKHFPDILKGAGIIE